MEFYVQFDKQGPVEAKVPSRGQTESVILS